MKTGEKIPLVLSKLQQAACDFQFRLYFGLGLITCLFLAIHLSNNLLPVLNMETERWDYPALLPYIHPIGTDFREGYFYPAKILLQGKSPYVDYNLIYPPFSALFSTPFRLFSVQTAYLVHAVILYILATGTVLFSVLSAVRAFGQVGGHLRRGAGQIALALFLLVSFQTLTSYGFLFSVERGNFDIYVMFFSVLAVWLLLSRPDGVWLPVILISIASHLKIYPAILFPLLAWKHGKRSILPLAVVNLLLLFSTGPINVVEFYKTIVRYSQNPFIWIGNHSAASFASFANHFISTRLGLSIPSLAFYMLPVLLWAWGGVVLWRRGYTPQRLLLLFALSVPLMNLIPSVSHDYKLVLLSAPLAMLLYLYLAGYAHSGKAPGLVKAVTWMALMFFITRTPYLLQGVFGNKYPFILLGQGIVLWTILFPERVVLPEATSLAEQDLAEQAPASMQTV